MSGAVLLSMWLLLVGFAVACLLVFVVSFAAFGDWMSTPIGRLTMSTKASTLLLFLFALGSVFWRLPVAIWLAGMLAFDVVICGQLVMLWKLQRIPTRIRSWWTGRKVE